MKKLFICLISLTLSVFVPLTALAAVRDDVESRMLGGALYLYSSRTQFSYTDSADFLTLIRSGSDISSYENDYIQSVKGALDQNSGKLLYNNLETTYLYASVLECLSALDMDTSNFYGYDLNGLLASSDITTIDNPYYYRVVFEACITIGANEQFMYSVLTQCLSGYTVGQGYDYWGFSCDNTANFLAAIAIASETFEAETSAYITDALMILDDHKTTDGYYFNSMYGTDANANSTATAMMAYSILNSEKADEAYNFLLNFEAEAIGTFMYMTGTGADDYATKDALVSLYYYAQSLPYESEEIPATSQETQIEKTEKNSVDGTAKRSPNTGNETEMALCSVITIGSFLAIIIAMRKKKA